MSHQPDLNTLEYLANPDEVFENDDVVYKAFLDPPRPLNAYSERLLRGSEGASVDSGRGDCTRAGNGAAEMRPQRLRRSTSGGTVRTGAVPPKAELDEIAVSFRSQVLRGT